MKVIIIKENGIIEEKEVGKEVEYDFMKKTINGLLELAERKIGRKYYSFWLNEEGRIYDLTPTVITDLEDFRGTVLVTRNKGAKTIGLTDEEIQEFYKNMRKVQLIYGNQILDIIQCNIKY